MLQWCQLCVGLVKTWHYYCRKVQWCQSWMNYHYYGTTAAMVSIVDVNYVWDWLKHDITIVQKYNGVNLRCQLCVGLVKTWHYYCTKVQWCQSWMKYHYYGTNASMVSIVDVNYVWDLCKNNITIVQIVQWCQSWMKYDYYCTNASMVSIVDVNYVLAWLKHDITTVQKYNGVNLEWNIITIVQILPCFQSWMSIMCWIG
jgi:hypothetical protein